MAGSILIYRSQTDGSYVPQRYTLEIFKDGKVRATISWLHNISDEKKVKEFSIEKQTVKKILEIYDNNSHIFSIKNIEKEADIPLILDGSSSKILFSDGNRRNELEMDDLGFAQDKLDYYKGSPNAYLFIKVCCEIDKILDKNLPEDIWPTN